jgi:hypothetical protein
MQSKQYAHVAQSVEHLLGKEEVEGSIPFVSTIFGNKLQRHHFSIPTFNDLEISSHGKG